MRTRFQSLRRGGKRGMARALRIILQFAVALALGVPAHAVSADAVRVGSKNFNESYLLAEIMSQLLEARGVVVQRRFGFGGTLICYGALENDEIDLYPEYTGTLAQAILKLSDLSAAADLGRLRQGLKPKRLTLLAPFGFDNTYAITLKQAVAEARGLRTIGDLRNATDLKLVFSHEFLERADGWPGLGRVYGLTLKATGIEHALAYKAIEDGSVDVTDAYSTDGELTRYGLVSLEDDQAFFPDYRALPIVREDLPANVRAVLAELAGTIDEQQMQALNARVVFEQLSFAEVANGFLVAEGLVPAGTAAIAETWQQRMVRNTVQHLRLTGIALAGAVVLALSLCVLVFRRRQLAQAILYGCSLLQTIPSIALLALLLPLFGVGIVPAIIALLLYALLPIVRNTLTALTTVDGTLIRVAEALGLNHRQQLRHLYLPMALPGIFAGIRTAAVICIGTATLAAFIGAGGLGDPIVTGLSLNNTQLILEGALPAAGLAIVTELLFEALERWLLPAHQRG